MTIFIGLLTLTLTACGHASVANKATGQAVTYHTPQTQLPSGVTSHLTSYKQRLFTRNKLPLDYALNASGTSVTINARNVLFVDPTEAYAIQQYKGIWQSLKTIPAVVWVNTSQSIAAKEWKQEGYAQDPLPSKETYYSTLNIPVPDSYHRLQSGWTELPGVLQPAQITEWTRFFHTGR